jgi:hypothetical protein
LGWGWELGRKNLISTGTVYHISAAAYHFHKKNGKSGKIEKKTQ